MPDEKFPFLTLKTGKLYMYLKTVSVTISTRLNQSVLLARAAYHFDELDYITENIIRRKELFPFLALQNPNEIIAITVLLFIMIRKIKIPH